MTCRVSCSTYRRSINSAGKPHHDSEQAIRYAIESTLQGIEEAGLMQAVILAGGLGTRLRPLTKTVPKPMVPVGGVPYLEYQLRLLRDQSITDIVLLIGYLGEQIEEHFG